MNDVAAAKGDDEAAAKEDDGELVKANGHDDVVEVKAAFVRNA